MVPFFQVEFQIGLSTIGLLLTALWGAYAIGHIPGGILGDRIGEGNVLVLSTVLSTAAILIVATAIDVWIFFAGTITFGVATALYGPTRFTILTDIYSKESGSAVGITLAAGSLGNTVFPAVSAVIATYVTWRFGFGVFVPAFAAVAIFLWITVPSRTSGATSAVDEFSRRTLVRIREGITGGSIPIFVSIQTCVSFIIQGFTSFYPAYLTVSKGLSPGVSAALFGLFFAIGAILQPIAGNVMNRIGARTALLSFLSSCVVALWLLPFAQGVVPLILVTVLFSSWNGCGVITQTYIADSLPKDMQGTGFGTVKAGWMVLGAMSPFLVGVFADYGYFDVGFFMLAIVGSVGILISVLYLPE